MNSWFAKHSSLKSNSRKMNKTEKTFSLKSLRKYGQKKNADDTPENRHSLTWQYLRNDQTA